MTVLRHYLLLLGLLGLGLVAGCRGGSSDAAIAETDEDDYRRGQAQVRQDRPQEALASFLKVIVKRGEQPSPESHLEAGLLYLKHSKNPIRASYHFEEYLAQQGPNSAQAARVRELLNTAKKDFARTLAGDPLENQAQRMDLMEKIAKLQRENDDLRNENLNLTLRGSAGTPSLKAVRAPATAEPPPLRANTPATVPITSLEDSSPITAAPLSARPLVTETVPPAVTNPPQVASPPPRTLVPATTTGGRTAPARPGAPPPAASTARRHTVAQGEGLYAIAKQYYGTGSAEKRKAIYDANRDVMKSDNDLRPGMVLKIP
jgi:nucleoid-associated protein YgaU